MRTVLQGVVISQMRKLRPTDTVGCPGPGQNWSPGLLMPHADAPSFGTAEPGRCHPLNQADDSHEGS